MLASLNHPNIAAICGVEDRALVMELVEGPTLAERIAKGLMPFDKALPLIHQLIDAIDYAREESVIQRHLKPANVKITPDCRVKVLDFGLAKALSGDPTASSPDLANSPPVTLRPVEHHRVLDAMESGPINVSAWPVDCVALEAMDNRFPRWLNCEAGIVRAVIEWS